MEIDLTRFKREIFDFLCTETIQEIDFGVLDLSYVEDIELKGALCFFKEVLTLELKVNYLENNTGIFRVQYENGRYCYREFGYVIEADSLVELKDLVLAEDRIWYVFDEELLENLKRLKREVVP